MTEENKAENNPMQGNLPDEPREGEKSNGKEPTPANGEGEPAADASERVSLTDLIREYAPPGEAKPKLPGFHPDSGWEFGTVCRRSAPGRKGETELCPVTGEQLPVTEPHIYVTARRDEFDGKPSVTAEFKHFVFPSPEVLREWFEEDQEA